jgi:hypothetical protein
VGTTPAPDEEAFGDLVEHEGRKTLSVDVYGHLPGILSVATKARKPLAPSGFDAESAEFAGARQPIIYFSRPTG